MLKNFFILAVFLSLVAVSTALGSGLLVKREERKSVVSTEYGQISAVRISDNTNGSYLMHFFTLEPNALFLPVILHADMVFYVHTGSGRLTWTEEDDTKQAELRRGDIYRLQQGSVFFIQSNLETQTERQKLRINAIFTNFDDLHGPITGAYSSIREMVTGFDRNVLQAAFMVPEVVIDEILKGTKQPAFIHAIPTTKKRGRDKEDQVISSVLDSRSYNIFESNKKKKKKDTENEKLFNIFTEDKDFENCNGWSTAVTRKKLRALRGTNIGAFMVNLTVGSMMGPHWNPMGTEIAMVLQGRGIVQVVCSDVTKEASCRNTKLLVEEGDVFVVPRFHPMAQMAFNNETFVFIGFSTSTKKNHPQFLAGQASVLRTLDKDVLAMAFNVTNTTFDQFLAPQSESVILRCTSCAEEELRVMQEDVKREREEARKREEEAAKEREQEKRREEEEARKREEAEARKQEEERKKREEEEEAAKRKEQEEEARRKEEAARRKEEEEAEARRKEQEEAEARQKEEEARKKEQEEAEARQKEEEARKKEQEEAEARQKEEEARRKEQEQAEARQKEEEDRRKEQEEAEARRKEEEEAEAARQEEERRRQEEEAASKREREEEERQRREEEEAAARKQEEERRKQEEQEGRGQEEEPQGGGQSEEEKAAEQERRMEEEARREAEEEAARQREGGGGSEEEPGDTPQLLKLIMDVL